MSETLQAELIASLKTENIQRRRAARAVKAENATLAARLAELEGQVTSLTTERDDFKQRLEAAPGDLQKTIDDLKGKLRDRDHKDAWTAALKDSPLHEKASVNTLWRELEYQVDSDVPDALAIKSLVERGKAEVPYLFAPTTDATSGGAPGGARPDQAQPTLPPGPGSGRGAPATDQGSFRVRRSDLADKAWMQQHGARYAAAYTAGEVTYVD
jgi:hypothetical protein